MDSVKINNPHNTQDTININCLATDYRPQKEIINVVIQSNIYRIKIVSFLEWKRVSVETLKSKKSFG